MPGEEAGGALGSFGEFLVSREVPALTLGVMVGGTGTSGSGAGAGGSAVADHFAVDEVGFSGYRPAPFRRE
jgi:hypothetical protein